MRPAPAHAHKPSRCSCSDLPAHLRLRQEGRLDGRATPGRPPRPSRSTTPRPAPGPRRNADVTKAEEQADKAQLAAEHRRDDDRGTRLTRAADDRGLSRLGQEPVGRDGEGPPVDVRRRCRHRVVHDRAPQAERGRAAAAGIGARRGVRQLLPLRVPARRRRLAVRGRDGCRAVAALAGPHIAARRRRDEGEVAWPSASRRTWCSSSTSRAR